MSRPEPPELSIGATRHADLIEAARGQFALAELDDSTRDGTVRHAAADAMVPASDSFTGYEILREIHRGGQGVVYQALQRSTNRKVAIKVMKEGPFAGAADKARFDREAQVLGQLRHPNIVTIHDTGVAAGFHYFVMDYISGQPLDVYMASGPRGVNETLTLFARICDAINAAHLRGIIHRDVKPGNIRIDAEGQPHVLDFGLAKTATSDVQAAAITMTGQFVGSLPWASPEQAEGAPGKIDIRTDVYSLGVVLYQMLTSKFPYEVVGNMGDVLDRIVKSEPVRPRTVRRQIDDEVETIVLKCLAKERERRYQSAGELGRDVERYLRHEPIEAKRDSLGYLLRKQLVRHRLPAAIAVLFVVVLATGFMTAAVLWRIAETAARRAEAEAARGDAVVAFVNEVFRSAQPGRVAEALDRAVAEVGIRYADDPLTEASVRDSIGLGYRASGRLTDAEAQVRIALKLWREHAGPEHAATLSSMNNLAVILRESGMLAHEARKLDEANELYAQAAERAARLWGREDARTLATLHNRADALQHLGDPEQAEAIFRDVLDTRRRLLGQDHADTLLTTQCLSTLLIQNRAFDEAGALLRDAVRRMERLSENNPLRIELPQTLALVHVGRGTPLKAEPLLEQAVAASQRIHGPYHTSTLEAKRELARCCNDLGRAGQARALMTAVIAAQRHAGASDYELLRSENLLAVILLELGEIVQAEEIIGRTRLTADAAVNQNDAAILISRSNEVALLRAKGQWEAAERRCGEVLESRETALGSQHPHVLRSLHDYGTLLAAQGKDADAEPYLARAVDGALQQLAAGHWLTGVFQFSYGVSLDALGKTEEARRQLAAAHQNLSESLGDSHARTKHALAALAEAGGEPDAGGVSVERPAANPPISGRP